MARTKYLSREEIKEMMNRIRIGGGSWNNGYLKFYPKGATALGRKGRWEYHETPILLKAKQITQLARQYQYYVDLSDSLSRSLGVENITQFEYGENYNLEATARKILAEHEELIRGIFWDKNFNRNKK